MVAKNAHPIKSSLLAFTVLCMIGSTSFAQNIEDYIESQKGTAYQKLYLHTDRAFYFEGDTLWFAAYLVDGQSHQQTDETCNLYVDLLSSTGKMVQNKLYVLNNGNCSGHFAINRDRIKEGKYLLRAYTDYLKNFGDDAVFTKNITISSIKSSFDLSVEDDSSSIIIDATINSMKKNKIDVSFLPEGGFLMAGESNCVAFKAVDGTGKGIDISGRLVDSNKNTLLTFETLYKGAGKFYFYPKAGETYTAVIKDRDNISYDLPKAKTNGLKLIRINQGYDVLQLMVQGKNPGIESKYYLVCTNRGRTLFFKELENENIGSIIKIDTERLGNGINRLVLLDDKLNPISERLIFHNNISINHLDVQIDKEAYATRENIQLNIKTPETYQNELALVSVSVVDENYISASGVSNNIASQLLLKSELKGSIESPADYFLSDDKISSQNKLDLLMCINGWSNYKWNSLESQTTSLQYKPKLGYTFKGRVNRMFSNRALTEGNVFFWIKNNISSQFLDIPLDKKGEFEIKNVVFYDSASVFVQARNKRNKHGIGFDMAMPEFKPLPIDKNRLNQLSTTSEIPVALYRKHYYNEMKLREFFPERNNILLEDIHVKGRSYLERWKTGNERISDGPYLITPEKTAGSPNIIEYVLNSVPKVYATRGQKGITIMGMGGLAMEANENYSQRKKDSEMVAPPDHQFKFEPLICIDYHLTLTVDEARNYSIDMFETIELIPPPMSYMYKAGWGVILLTTKRGRTLNEVKQKLISGDVQKIKGFTAEKDFYSPRYTLENIKTNIPDFRNTLYWNSGTIIGSGEGEMFFNACDNVARYKVQVEGITAGGKICIGEAKFEVDRQNNSAVNYGN